MSKQPEIGLTIPKAAVQLMTSSTRDTYDRLMTGRVELMGLLTFGFINTPIIETASGMHVGMVSYWLDQKMTTACRVDSVDPKVYNLIGVYDEYEMYITANEAVKIYDRALAEEKRPTNPKRTQRKRTKGFRLPPNTLCVTRPGNYGNPFSPRNMSRAAHQEAVERFREWILSPKQAALRKEAKEVMPQYDYLACWCHPKKACHVDVWIELLDDCGKQL